MLIYGEEMQNIAAMLRSVIGSLSRLAQVADGLAIEVDALERRDATAVPAETTRAGPLPPNVIDLRDPAIWRRCA